MFVIHPRIKDIVLQYGTTTHISSYSAHAR